MKIIVVCQAVDERSSTLGFFIEWLKELARQCETVEVIAFKVGLHDLPANVHAHDARAWGDSVIARYARYKLLLLKLVPKVDAVFVHMSPEYAIVAAPIAAIWRKPTFLWYSHRSVTWRLKLAALMVKRILTISPTSCRLETPKKVALGHGIPTNIFRPMTRGERDHRAVTVGRITPIKRIELMIEALAIARAQGVPATLDVIGEAIYDADKAYEGRIRALAAERGVADAVRFLGALPYAEFPVRYASYALALNMAPTGALDKAVLEAMSCGLPALVSNGNFRPVLGKDADRLVATETADDVASKMRALLQNPDSTLPARLRAIVERDHSLTRLIRGIMELYAASL